MINALEKGIQLKQPYALESLFLTCFRQDDIRFGSISEEWPSG